MDYDRIIAISNDVAVYRHGNKCIKVFIHTNKFSSALEESLKTQKVKELTSLNIPQVYSVVLKDNKVEIFSDYIEGETLLQELKNNSLKMDETIVSLVALQKQINAFSNVLNCDKTANNDAIDQFLDKKQYLCHGNLTLENVVKTPSGELFVINWGSAFEGDRRIDFAITYFNLLYSFGRQIADMYLNVYVNENGETKENLFKVSEFTLKNLIKQSKGDKKIFFSELIKNNLK